MDLRTIMNDDAAGAANKPAAQPPPSPLRRVISSDPLSNQPRDEGSPVSYQGGYGGWPSQPPLQPHRSPGGSSSYSSIQSPYQLQHQRPSAPTLTTTPGPGPHPHPPSHQPVQSPAHGPQTYPPQSRDSSSHPQQQTTVPLSALSTQSPYTSQQQAPIESPQSYFPHQRSQSSHSIPTPTSTYKHPYPQGSPRSADSQQSHHSSQQFPPPSQQRSQPGTPLGPPASYQRLSPQTTRPVSSGLDSRHSQQPQSPWGSQDTRARDQRSATSPVPPAPVSRQNSRPPTKLQKQTSLDRDREKSVSVSPKTIVPNSLQGEGQGYPDQAAPADRGVQQPGKQRETPGESFSVQTNNSQPAIPPQNESQPKTPRSSYPPASASPHYQSSSPSKPPSMPDATSSIAVEQPAPTPVKPTVNTTPGSTSLPRPPKRRRTHYDEPPIYARKAPRTGGNSPMLPARRPYASSGPSKLKHETSDATNPASWNPPKQKSIPPPPPVKNQVNGQSQSPMNGHTPAPLAEPAEGSLGPWEPSITGVIPHEEITKTICDFLFQQVVMRKDIGASPAGGAAEGSGAILEIEAKLGQIVDKHRGERLRLPVLTECVISKDDPGIRTAFESSMSLAQHRALNNFLNDSVKHSMPQPGSKRIPLTYAHKKERDTFYEISAAALPPVVQHNLHARHKPKVRVTSDQRTGEVLAKIVKCRLADLDVYSPRTCLDWRVSVNLEMNYEGDVSELTVASDNINNAGMMGRKTIERNKDRMSYRHLAYQVDLTQVATTEPPTKSDFEHELEIEISSAEVRRQGDLALAGDSKNQYEELVKGFVDNVRVLARAVPER
ncbi:mRNA-capping enzyme subunit beta [Arachnomyces sp. PD_36]|nr:mRNA-capping enzyme subunit beta [Arachnomyces sp. PD_36]